MPRADGLATEHWGPAIWSATMGVGRGLAFGAACAVKWSGLYFLAAFGVYLVVVDALARRRAGVPFWASGAVLKQGPVTFLLYVPIARSSTSPRWTGWFVTDGGYYRHWASTPEPPATGVIAWVPPVSRASGTTSSSAYTYHVGVSRRIPTRRTRSPGCS